MMSGKYWRNIYSYKLWVVTGGRNVQGVELRHLPKLSLLPFEKCIKVSSDFCLIIDRITKYNSCLSLVKSWMFLIILEQSVSYRMFVLTPTAKLHWFTQGPGCLSSCPGPHWCLSRRRTGSCSAFLHSFIWVYGHMIKWQYSHMYTDKVRKALCNRMLSSGTIVFHCKELW